MFRSCVPLLWQKWLLFRECFDGVDPPDQNTEEDPYYQVKHFVPVNSYKSDLGHSHRPDVKRVDRINVVGFVHFLP